MEFNCLRKLDPFDTISRIHIDFYDQSCARNLELVFVGLGIETLPPTPKSKQSIELLPNLLIPKFGDSLAWRQFG